MNGILLGIFAYILVQLFIGIVLSKRIRDESDYLLAGRSLGLGFGSFTVFATWFGAETCVGAAGSVYKSGLSGGSADPFGYAACLLLMGLLFAGTLWRMRLTTLADLFRQRYSPGVEKLVVLMLAPTSVIWAAAQIRAFGQVISASSSFEVDLAITLAAGVVIVYTVYGGLLADVYTDFVQGIALIVGLGMLYYVIMDANGGLAATVNAIDPARLNIFGGDKPPLERLEAWAIPVTGSLFAQELVSRVLASRSSAVARGACLWGGGIYLAVGLLPVLIGLAGMRLMPGLDDPEQILPKLAQQHLSEFVYILFAGALISAILSTVDSALLAAAALTSHNLILPMAGQVSEVAKVRVARVAVVIYGLIAYLLALQSEGVHDLVEQASAFGGAGVFVVILFGLYTSHGAHHSAYAALLLGILGWLLADKAFGLSTPYLVSLVFAVLAYLFVGLLERWKPTWSSAPSAASARGVGGNETPD
ncbi:sodium:solute symporter family protein [Methylococcus sp. EFPC2]|uniref:sodium:solute symporter family protein n=1 Tax=Methylococcus sp. EFPC2 TaxID=2812648 RepID=UPI0019670264|nr:sodium:solute symporter family protein [Methylococcus sp. EFPC2]QSA98798.1 sodium:solute symporter family protein [Methylococcus sp. EFPC2]